MEAGSVTGGENYFLGGWRAGCTGGRGFAAKANTDRKDAKDAENLNRRPFQSAYPIGQAQIAVGEWFGLKATIEVGMCTREAALLLHPTQQKELVWINRSCPLLNLDR